MEGADQDEIHDKRTETRNHYRGGADGSPPVGVRHTYLGVRERNDGRLPADNEPAVPGDQHRGRLNLACIYRLRLDRHPASDEPDHDGQADMGDLVQDSRSGPRQVRTVRSRSSTRATPIVFTLIDNDTVAHDLVIGPPYNIVINATVPGLVNDLTQQTFTTTATNNSPGVVVQGKPGNVTRGRTRSSRNTPASSSSSARITPRSG